jgi:hypothetical protein
MTRSQALLPVFLLASCGGSPPPAPPPKPAAPAANAARPAARAPAPGAAPAVAVADIRKKVLKDEDFVESPTNRDPFHSFIGDLSAERIRAPSDYYVWFDKYACEELKLIAVVTGGLDPRALFRDPSGLGIPLKVGDHICKAHWRIKRIVAEGVVVEVEKDTGGTRPEKIERMIPMNSGEKDTQ